MVFTLDFNWKINIFGSFFCNSCHRDRRHFEIQSKEKYELNERKLFQISIVYYFSVDLNIPSYLKGSVNTISQIFPAQSDVYHKN